MNLAYNSDAMAEDVFSNNSQMPLNLSSKQQAPAAIQSWLQYPASGRLDSNLKFSENLLQIFQVFIILIIFAIILAIYILFYYIFFRKSNKFQICLTCCVSQFSMIFVEIFKLRKLWYWLCLRERQNMIKNARLSSLEIMFI